MKITAGLGSADEYIRFVEAGADEFFSGFVPYSWTEKYGTVIRSLNGPMRISSSTSDAESVETK